MTPQAEAVRLLEESVAASENPKGSLVTSIQKLSRAAALLHMPEVQIWCSIQLGDQRYTKPLKALLEAVRANDDESKKKVGPLREKLISLGVDLQNYSTEELNVKINEAGGGFISIGFVEERYADLVRLKHGNDGTYYKNHLYAHLNYVRRRAHERASELLDRIRFAGTTRNCFDILRSAVDDKLLDLDPNLAEQFMHAFKGVSSSSEEEWSQALTTCRRLLEGLADALYPANSDATVARVLTQAQYINRLWAFMDKAIESDSNKALAKAHIDFLGAWMEKTNKIANKGVHAEVGQLEAVKAVFHTYLVVADILDYLKATQKQGQRPNINSASLDELEAVLEIKRTVAKAIVKARVESGKLDVGTLKKVSGVGAKTIERALAAFSF